VLSDGQITVRDKKIYVASVRYRCSEGRPLAGHWYRCDLTVIRNRSNIAGIVGDYDGATFPVEGVISKELNVGSSRPFQPGETIEFRFLMLETALADNGRRVPLGPSALSQPLVGTTQVPK
jgi:hypothetical protein